MANISIKPGKKVTLQCLAATKIHVDETFLCHGYVLVDKIKITVDGSCHDYITSKEGGLYPMKPEFDNDFYVLVEMK